MSILHNTEVNGNKKWIYKIIVSLLALGVPLQIFPYIWMISSSLKDNTEVRAVPITLIPKVAHFENIIKFLLKTKLWDNLYNTLIYCFGTIIVQVTISALAAYALSKFKFKGSNIVFFFLLGTMMLDGNALMIPTFLMMLDFPIIHVNLIDNPLSVILAGSAWAWSVFMFKGFFDSLPNELLESARIDGATNSGIFTKIVVPLAKPAFAVVILNTFMAVYNSLYMPLILMPNKKGWSIMVKIFYLKQEYDIGWNALMMMLVVATIPVMIFYILCQKYIVQGISMTGLKG